MNLNLEKYLNTEYYKTLSYEPDFGNFLRMLSGEKTQRPVLFEFDINIDLLRSTISDMNSSGNVILDALRVKTEGYKNLGYDYTIITVPGLIFKPKLQGSQKHHTVSLNEAPAITDWKSFEKHTWPDPDSLDYSIIDDLAKELPDGMKILIRGEGGVFENVIELTGFDNLCYMLMDEPELVAALFEAVGSRFEKYYANASDYDAVGAIVCNDDWGFKTQTMFSLPHMRQYVTAWHRKILKTTSKSNKPALLHSCGNLAPLMDDIIDDIGYSGKHSYEDTIVPVEEAYELWGNRVSIIGGIDVDFLCRSTPEEIFNRSTAMLERTRDRSRYALGSGNSIPAYVPVKNFLAMVAAAHCFE